MVHVLTNARWRQSQKAISIRLIRISARTVVLARQFAPLRQSTRHNHILIKLNEKPSDFRVGWLFVFGLGGEMNFISAFFCFQTIYFSQSRAARFRRLLQIRQWKGRMKKKYILPNVLWNLTEVVIRMDWHCVRLSGVSHSNCT